MFAIQFPICPPTCAKLVFVVFVSETLSGGAIAGITFLCLLFVVVILLVVWYFLRRHRNQNPRVDSPILDDILPGYIQGPPSSLEVKGRIIDPNTQPKSNPHPPIKMSDVYVDVPNNRPVQQPERPRQYTNNAGYDVITHRSEPVYANTLDDDCNDYVNVPTNTPRPPVPTDMGHTESEAPYVNTNTLSRLNVIKNEAPFKKGPVAAPRKTTSQTGSDETSFSNTNYNGDTALYQNV